jgi:hypothetical protein
MQLGKKNSIIDWLLEDDNPSVRYFTLRDLLGRKESDSGLHGDGQKGCESEKSVWIYFPAKKILT